MITIKRTFCPGRGMIRPEELTGYVFSPEAAAHMFIITKMEKVDGQEAAVPFDAGTDISCRFIKANGVTELVDGDLTDDGAASITLPAECYQVPGRFILSIYAETSEETICIYSATATALAGDTDEVNVSSNTKRTIDAQIDALNDAVENAQEVIDSIPQDYTALSDSVSDLKSTFDSVTTTGENKFNKNTASIGRRIRPDGTEAQVSNAYHSELIPVVPGSTLYIARGLGSSSNITCCFFDTNKDYVSGSNVVRTNTDAFSTTVPADCYYMILNGATAYIDSMYVYTANISDYLPYHILPNGRTGNVIGLYSGSRIYYKDGVLFSASQLRLRTFERTYTLGTSVTVGTGIWLFFNSQTHELFAGNDYSVISDSVYFVCGIGVLNTYNADDGFMGFLGYTPVIEVDLANNKLRYKSAENAYLYVHSGRYTLSAQTAEFTMTQYTVLYYDRADTQLHVTNTYNENTTSRVVLLERLGSSIVSITPYVSLINENANAGKTCVCYGDSLTWYDGNEFTWGEQQGTVCVGYESYLRAYNGMTVTNRGQNGKTTPQICTNLESAEDLDGFDYLILMGGNNDDRMGVDIGTIQPVGGTFDTTTVSGALQSAIEYALTENPNLRIILMTEPMGWTYEDDALKRVSELIPNTYRNVAKLYGLPLIDLWEKSGVNELTRNNYYLDPSDETNTSYMYHPDNNGWRQISKIICNEIKQY